ncbi:Cof-type HAD-IIB family hydrolase [Carnobacterium sp.]|uniref:Cof-type HAD-IIB family hydrolase n=1 Tax=Carnobacterium sp. TaxID=48221 RepID=UPI0028ACA22D|nr:Cof-type HAD-IIB family hydrolase [Carnobacterium sp.]
METKYIFLDVDGTLVSYFNELPDSAVEAIKSAQANGHKIYTVTGRSKAEMYDYILDIGFDGYIGGNGNYVESDNEVILHQLMTEEEERRIIDWLHDRKLEFYLESNNGLFASEHFEKRGEQTVKDYVAYKEKSGAEAMTVRKVFPEMIFGENLYRDDVNKISFILNDYQDYLDAVEAFPAFKVGTWGGVGEKALFGDIALDNITKQTAIETLLNHHNAKRKDTIAFGDAKVDIPMLDYCEGGVAMGNGGEEIKAMADHITDTVEKDGLQKAFRHFGLIV